jgi:hypothetical protein
VSVCFTLPALIYLKLALFSYALITILLSYSYHQVATVTASTIAIIIIFLYLPSCSLIPYDMKLYLRRSYDPPGYPVMGCFTEETSEDISVGGRTAWIREGTVYGVAVEISHVYKSILILYLNLILVPIIFINALYLYLDTCLTCICAL